MTRLSAALAMILFALPAGAAEMDISGDYAMKGTSLINTGPGYAGDCTLTPKGKTYDVNCVNTGSGDKYAGKGIVRGDHFSLYLGEYLVVYKIAADGKLVGNWAHARSDDYGEEILTPKSKPTKTN